MIVITGATGALNGATLEHLLTLVPAGQIGVSVRDVTKARALADRGVRVRRGSIDFDLPEPLIEFDEWGAMTGVTRAPRN